MFERFNIPNDRGDGFLCPVCGFPDFAFEPAYDARGGRIGDTLCSCCGFQPGFDDDPMANPDALPDILASILCCRARWQVDHGWHGVQQVKPMPFDGPAQLASLRRKAPHLFPQ